MRTYQISTLPNGVKVATVSMPSMETVSLGIFIGVGGRDESPEQKGIAHFLEHAVFKGSKKRDMRSIALDIEGNGGSLNAYTSKDYTCYEAKGPKELLSLMSDVLVDMVLHPIFPPDEIEKERQVIEEELVMYEENPSDHVQDIFEEALWGNHPLSYPLVGTSESLKQIGVAELNEFHQYYTQRSHVFSVVGDIDHQDVVDMVSAMYSDAFIEKQGESLFFDPSDNPVKTCIVQKEIEQAHLVIGYRSFGRYHVDRFALRLLSVLLGESMSSRLFQEVREKRGLAYSVYSDLDIYEECGSFSITAGVDIKKKDEALRAIQEQIDLILEGDVTDDELEQAKRYLMGQWAVSMDTTSGQLSWVGENALYHDEFLNPFDVKEKFLSVTVDEVHRIAQEVFSQEPARAYILAE